MPYINIQKGDYFGDLDYVVRNHEGKRTFTVQATDLNCEVYTLNRQDLDKLNEEFKEVINKFFIDATLRLKYALKVKERAENFAIHNNTNFKDNHFLQNV